MIFIASDHAAFNEKEMLRKYLLGKGHEVLDLGTHSKDSTNYADYAKALALEVASDKGVGILICGSGIGVSMVANRYKNVRAALCRSAKEARLAKNHNDANVLCLGARITSEIKMVKIVNAWLKAKFEGGRHIERLASFNLLGE